MSNTQTFFIGAMILAASLILSQGLPQAQAASGGPFQLMHHSNTSAYVGVFRLDTGSGEVSYCFVNNDNKLLCSDWVK